MDDVSVAEVVELGCGRWFRCVKSVGWVLLSVEKTAAVAAVFSPAKSWWIFVFFLSFSVTLNTKLPGHKQFTVQNQSIDQHTCSVSVWPQHQIKLVQMHIPCVMLCI